MNKFKQSESGTVTKAHILGWINRTLKTNESRIQSFGNGIVYCLLINHFHPNVLPKSKVTMVPRTSFDNKTNLKRVQDALKNLGVKTIVFDIFRVSELGYMDNWELINKFYKHFEAENYLSQSPSTTSVLQNRPSKLNMNPTQSKSQLNNSVFISGNLNGQPSRANGSGMLTPMKGMKFFQDNSSIQCQTVKLMHDIKSVVKSDQNSDKAKVKQLKQMLGLIQNQEDNDHYLNDDDGFGGGLLSDCKKKQEIITID